MSTAYLKSARLVNFGPHDDTFVEFDANEILIVGSNDAGKSKLLEGIRCALFNDSIAKTSQRYGTNTGSITLHFSDGRILTRHWKGTSHSVTLKRPGWKEPKDYPKYTQASDVVAEFTGIRKFLLDDNEKPVNLNYIPLGAPPFLLDKGPDKLMRVLLGAVAGKGLESAKVKIVSKLNDVQVDIKARNRQLDLAKSNYDQYKKLPLKKWDAELDEIEVRETKLQSKRDLLELIDEYIAESKVAEHEESVLNDTYTLMAKLDSLSDRIASTQSKENTLAVIQAASRELKLLKREEEELWEKIEFTQRECIEAEKALTKFKCTKCHRLVTVHE